MGQTTHSFNTTYITLVATLGGLLFGYDTAVVSGAIGSVQVHFSLSDTAMGFAASCALLGCILGALIAGYICTRFGRKSSLLFAALLFFVSAVGSALPDVFSLFIFYRILGGIGVGIASMLSPMYIAEIAPSPIRGRLVSYNQLAIVFGILLIYFVNYYISLQGDSEWNTTWGWRWMFGSEAIPAALFFFLLLSVPKSPRWLIMKGRTEEARKVLEKISDSKESAQELKAIHSSLQKEKDQATVTFGNLFQKGIFRALLIGIGLSVLQQVTGINVFLYYAPEIFKKMGDGMDTALIQTIIVGAVNLLFTIIAIVTVDRFGRKPLMVIGSVGMSICMLSIGFAAYFQNTDGWLLIFILGYIAFFALSLGPVTWVLLAEIYPNRIRSIALSIAVAAQWTFNYIVSQTFPMMMGSETLNNMFHGAFPFWLYGIMCIVSMVFNWGIVPETKGKRLEEMDLLWKK